jgi:lactoylglutathione lyase
MPGYLHTAFRIADAARSRRFYETLGLEVRREAPYVRDGVQETHYMLGFPGGPEVLQLTVVEGVDSYDLGTGYNHIAILADDLDTTLERLAGEGIEPEKPPYTVSENGPRLCFVRDPDGYRIELIEKTG